MIRITHIISSLEVAGAQMMLYKLLSATAPSAVEARVISLSSKGAMSERIEACGVPVNALEMSRSIPNPVSILRLSSWLRQHPADIIQTWMYHADLIGGVAAKLSGHSKIIWGIRHSDLDPAKDKRSTIMTARACAQLSPVIPTKIVCNSENSRQYHAAFGYQEAKMLVIPNGFDLEAFKPDAEARKALREELGIPPDSLIIGHIGRFHPQKDYPTLLAAAGILNREFPDVHFVLCGEKITPENAELVEWARAASVEDRVHLLGRRSDVPRLTAGFDIATLSSTTEAFPNVVGEAMACGVPCVVTDVGDAAQIVADAGRVVPARDPAALANGWRELLRLSAQERCQLGQQGRARVLEHYSLSKVSRQFQELYDYILSRA